MFRKFKLKDLTLKIGSGSTPKGGDSVYINEGVSLIRSQNVLDFSFSKEGLVFIDEQAAYALKNVTLEKNDVLLNITGDSVARVCQVPDEIIPARVNQHVAIIRADKHKLNSEFLKYYLLNPSFKNWMLTLAGDGATRKALTKGMIEEFEILLPPLKEQQAIAEMLSSLDDKIEHNLQINKTLEEIAMALYQEWFVDFGPFKDGKFVKSELGLIPEEWRVMTLDEILTDKNQGVNTTTEKVEYSLEGIPVIRAKNILKNRIDFDDITYVSQQTFQKIREQCKPKINDILYTNIGSQLGNAALLKEDHDFAIAWNVLRLRVNNEIFSPSLLTVFLNESKNRQMIYNLNSSSTMPFVSGKALGEIKIIVPNNATLTKIKSLIDEQFNLLSLNNQENRILGQLRNVLLPKLISGEIIVKDLEKQIAKVL